MKIIDKIDNILNEKKLIDFTKDDKIIELFTNLNMLSQELKRLKQRRIKYRTDDELEKWIGSTHKERNLAHKKLIAYIDKLMEE